MNQESPNQLTGRSTVLVFCNDLFFAMRIRNALKPLGFRIAIVKAEAEFASAAGTEHLALGLIDFNHAIDWDSLAPALAATDVPTIAFGPHKDTAGFAAARAAGITRVISNGAFTGSLPDLVQKYAVAQD